MWLVTNNTPYEADGRWIQDKDANKIWLVAVKATFDILKNGSCILAEEQVPVLGLCEPTGPPGESSLRYESDLSGLKVCTDVLVQGSAWAPPGKVVSSLDTQLSLDSIDKRVRVFGDRVWERTLVGTIAPSYPESFDSMPIVYERAFGGWDRTPNDPSKHRLESRNPVGVGFAVTAESCVGTRLPNLEYPEKLIESWKDRPPPAGFNAVECHWSPRRELAGTYDDKWLNERFPLWAEDFDSRYNNCAPHDQQTSGFLRGGERARLLNLSENGELCFVLPKLYPFLTTHFGSDRVDHRAQLCTVVIEPNVSRVMMVWQSSLVCNKRVDELDATVVTEKRFV